MTKVVEELVVYFTVLTDGTHLAVSKSEPLFSVAGKDFEEAEARAHEILSFHNERCSDGTRVERTVAPPERQSRTLTPFVPSRVERFTALADCA